MYCNQCGKQIVDESRFCNFCGAKVVILPQDNLPSRETQPSQPVQPVSQPVQPVAQPVQPVPQPVQPVVQPVVQPAAQPSQPVEPVQPQHATQRVSLKETLIKQACKDVLEKRLKSPATVHYAVMDITDEDKYGRYCLYVELDSQNSFGALVRSKYRVVLQAVYTDGTYSALSEAALPVSFINTEEMIKKINKWNTHAYELGLFEKV